MGCNDRVERCLGVEVVAGLADRQRRQLGEARDRPSRVIRPV